MVPPFVYDPRKGPHAIELAVPGLRMAKTMRQSLNFPAVSPRLLGAGLVVIACLAYWRCVIRRCNPRPNPATGK